MNTTAKIFELLNKICDIVEPVSLKSVKIVAAITYKGEIISLGSANNKTHPLQQKFQDRSTRIYLHAEIDAIRKARKIIDLSLCKLYICRTKKFYDPEKNIFVQGWGYVKPCLGCQKAIKNFGIQDVFYTIDSLGCVSWEKLIISDDFEKFNPRHLHRHNHQNQ